MAEIPLKIAVDAREFSVPGRATGIGRYLENMLTPLSGDSGYRFTLYTHHPEAVPEGLARAPQVAVESLPSMPTVWVDQWALPRLAADLGADLFFSPYYKGPLFARMPLIITVHDIMFLRLPIISKWRKFMIRRYLGAVLSRAARVIVVSKFSERDLTEEFPEASGKTRVLYSDMGEKWYNLLAACGAGATPSIPPEPLGRYFLYVGNFKPHKNVDLLVRAFAEARRQAPELREYRLVLIGGDDANAPRILRLIARLDLGDAVVIYRDVDDVSLACFYQSAAWFVTASAYEGFGYPCVEAMVAGCPVICHQATSLIEVVGGAALRIASLNESDVAAALLKAARMAAEERRQLIEAGKRQARLFKPGESARSFAVLCRQVVEEAARSSAGGRARS